jgi:hypothetical protein
VLWGLQWLPFLLQDNFLASLESHQLDIDTSDVTVGTLGKAFKWVNYSAPCSELAQCYTFYLCLGRGWCEGGIFSFPLHFYGVTGGNIEVCRHRGKFVAIVCPFLIVSAKLWWVSLLTFRRIWLFSSSSWRRRQLNFSRHQWHCHPTVERRLSVGTVWGDSLRGGSELVIINHTIIY